MNTNYFNSSTSYSYPTSIAFTNNTNEQLEDDTLTIDKESQSIIEYIQLHTSFFRITSSIIPNDSNLGIALHFYFGDDPHEYVFLKLSLSNGLILRVTGDVCISDFSLQNNIERLGITRRFHREYMCSNVYEMLADVRPMGCWSNVQYAFDLNRIYYEWCKQKDS